ncbi:DUF2752 domain-containing protein [Acinetobacter sp. VNH17]|uniref:DUF2752 domain-containing protein n=1 Tax=Acinetobacter thutiue TaxID=2998078 RepID=A0ABT7WN05_9GAMM|nr:DUF2752 domain-containing protein [Acinetobacter thutiue]MCY6411958.1 DUF2752 domain-containing protein [Acinetobacter thutiue]MDN0014062.1 DUF2752 domain-containing protein [Acinetobacter thutiue]
MKTRCPACGATTSLDALLGHSEASRAFVAAINLVGDLAKPMIQYLGMFRSENRDLTFERASKLLNELAADINAKQIKRGHHFYPAPKAAWIWAINTIIERRDQGKLQLPFKNHGYLYEVLTSYKPEYAPVQDSRPRHAAVQAAHAKTDAERATDQAEHERKKHERPAVPFAELIKQASEERKAIEASSLKGIPKEQLFAHVNQNRCDGETHKQCFDRLKAAELEQEQEQTN